MVVKYCHLQSTFINNSSLLGFIGYAPELYQLVSAKEVKDTDDDQLYYTNMYLDPEMRKQLNIKLDHRSTLFQNLNGALGMVSYMPSCFFLAFQYTFVFLFHYLPADVELRLEAENSFIKNTAYATVPLVVHGNGPSKSVLNALGNYVAKSWSLQDGCYSCNENSIDLSKKQVHRHLLNFYCCVHYLF